MFFFQNASFSWFSNTANVVPKCKAPLQNIYLISAKTYALVTFSSSRGVFFGWRLFWRNNSRLSWWYWKDPRNCHCSGVVLFPYCLLPFLGISIISKGYHNFSTHPNMYIYIYLCVFFSIIYIYDTSTIFTTSCCFNFDTHEGPLLRSQHPSYWWPWNHRNGHG